VPKSFEDVLFKDAGLHQLRLPRSGIKVFDVQAQDGGRAVGRYQLSDLLDGDFTQLKVLDAADLADLNRATSKDYNLNLKADVGGLAGLIAKAKGALATKGAHQVSFRWVDATLEEADHGALDNALYSSTIRQDGPLARGLAGVVITAVAATRSYVIELVDADGGSVAGGADAAEAVSVALDASAEVSSKGGLQITHATPVVFAVRAQVLKRGLLGKLRVITPKGALTLLGDDASAELDQEFVDALGLCDNIFDFD